MKNNYKLLAYFLIPFLGVLLIKYLSESSISKTIVLQEKDNLTDIDFKENSIEKVDFNFDVKPILSDKCYACHGPDDKARKADLRLDTKEGFYNSLQDANHFVIDRKNPDKSELIKRISSENISYVMPPPESNLKLTKKEKNILKLWIVQGANWEPHWSYTKPKLPKIPETIFESWSKNEIDFFIAKNVKK